MSHYRLRRAAVEAPGVVRKHNLSGDKKHPSGEKMAMAGVGGQYAV